MTLNCAKGLSVAVIALTFSSLIGKDLLELVPSEILFILTSLIFHFILYSIFVSTVTTKFLGHFLIFEDNATVSQNISGKTKLKVPVSHNKY